MNMNIMNMNMKYYYNEYFKTFALKKTSDIFVENLV